jgi:hypothetical protein
VKFNQARLNPITDRPNTWIICSKCFLAVPPIVPFLPTTEKELWEHALRSGWTGEPELSNACCPYCSTFFGYLFRAMCPDWLFDILRPGSAYVPREVMARALSSGGWPCPSAPQPQGGATKSETAS